MIKLDEAALRVGVLFSRTGIGAFSETEHLFWSALVFGSADLSNDLGLPSIRGNLSPALVYGRAKLIYDASAGRLLPTLNEPFLRIGDEHGSRRDEGPASLGGRWSAQPQAIRSEQASESLLAMNDRDLCATSR